MLNIRNRAKKLNKLFHTILNLNYTHSPSAADEADSGPAIDRDFFEVTELPAGTTNYDPGYYYAWYVASGTAVGKEGDDFHGACAVRFDTKVKDGPLGEGGERYYNYVLCVRDINRAYEDHAVRIEIEQ